jgi:alkaline phosphatase D
MTCQGYPDRGHPEGHPIYPAMQALSPRFACLTGDLVYYDNDEPRAVTPALARYHWERMFSLPRLREFTRHVATYWLKDDHDTVNNDAWPGRTQGTLTFEEGQKIFREQAPMLPDGPGYRTFRHGKDLQIWLIEGRDHRSANNAPDGAHKTILGTDQKAWLKETLAASDATWKILVSPTPIVGPDRGNKHDNHSNAAFAHEGDELRAWFRSNVPDNFFVICGDRHWQYHSVHPVTGLHEFSVGPASDEHAADSPGENPRFQRFHRVKGGFLSVSVSRCDAIPHIRFELRDIHGTVVYHFKAVGQT